MKNFTKTSDREADLMEPANGAHPGHDCGGVCSVHRPTMSAPACTLCLHEKKIPPLKEGACGEYMGNNYWCLCPCVFPEPACPDCEACEKAAWAAFNDAGRVRRGGAGSAPMKCEKHRIPEPVTFCYAPGDEGAEFCGDSQSLHCGVLGDAAFWESVEGQEHLVKCMRDDHLIHHPFVPEPVQRPAYWQSTPTAQAGDENLDVWRTPMFSKAEAAMFTKGEGGPVPSPLSHSCEGGGHTLCEHPTTCSCACHSKPEGKWSVPSPPQDDLLLPCPWCETIPAWQQKCWKRVNDTRAPQDEVSLALAELREMFPTPFTFTICVFVKDDEEHWTLSSPRTALIKADSLAEAMNQVREHHRRKV